MYRDYIFDLYGTLVDIHTNESKQYLWTKMADMFACYGAHYSPKELRACYRNYVKELEENIPYPYPEIQLEKVFQFLFEDKNIIISHDTITHLGHTFRVLSRDYLKLYPGVMSLLDTLTEKKKGIYLLSNAQRMFTEYEMRVLGIYSYFDGILLSSDAGCKKPQATFMKELLSTYHLNIADCVMIGNDVECDIGVANAVGMDSIYIHSNLSPEVTQPISATHTIMNGDVNTLLTYIR
ncbi:MAG: HAD family hydrolase [Lachnospiraceae bacterium]|nr:HAD family hydrolase [Lachnospiraceae bacterium]